MALMDFVQHDTRNYAGLSGLACACQNMGAPGLTAGGLGQWNRGGGLGSINQIGPGLWVDSDTGRNVVAYGDGTWVDGATGAVMGRDGRIVGNMSSGVPGSGGSSVVQAILDAPGKLTGAVGMTPAQALQLGLSMSGKVPQAAPAPAPGPSSSTILLALLGIGAAGAGAYALSKKK